MRKLTIGLLCCLVICLFTVSAFAAVDVIKNENGELIKISRKEVKAFNDKDVEKGFYNYAEWDSVHNFNDSNGARVVGVVYDEDSEEYIKNAWIENMELGFKVKTDKNGRFEINNLPDGEYTWIVKAPGYKGSTYSSFPVNKALGASIYRFSLSSNRAIHSDLKADKKKVDCNHDSCNQKETATTEKTSGDVSIKSPHSGWPVIVNFTVMYNNVIYSPTMDDYLYYVVASELWAPNSSLYSGIPSANLLQGFKAQAVTARTYADYQTRMYNRHSGYDLCSTTHCQVYNPSYTNQMSIDAVNGTTNQMLLVIYNWPTYDYDFVEAVFSASCLGSTKNNEDVWGGTPRSYLRGVPCPYDLRPTLDSGHNVGLCQDGAIGYAKNGYTYIQILAHYFTGTTNKICNPQVR